MATSTHTSNYNLSQYAAGDQVKFLTNYNQDMAAIDAALKAIHDSDTAKVPSARTVAGLPLSADIALAQLTDAGLAFGDGSGNAQNALKLGGVDAANFPQVSSGTWTPTLHGYNTAGSPTFTNSCDYIKIGNLCYISITINLTNLGGMAGAVIIGGFPFTIVAYSMLNFAVCDNLALTSGHVPLGICGGGGTNMTAVYAITSGGVAFGWIDSSELTNTSILRISGIYHC